ncbi:hypothetical protein Q5X54_05170 [Acinetobacter baumannii]|nr:hypothetical protein [Acinetobacter baumannii]MDV7490041.1 hypothetical protein [Acinetobacter baumannii]
MHSKKRLLLIFTFSILIVGFFYEIFDFTYYYGARIISEQVRILFQTPIPISIVTGLLVIIPYLVLKYLDKEPISKDGKINQKISKESILAEINEELLKKTITNSEISEAERKELIEEIKIKIENQASADYFNQFKSKLRSELVQDNYETKTNITLYRLERERISLARRGNLNLVLGMMLSFIGLAILASSIFNASREYIDLIDLLLHMLPKTVLALFIEVFAYFFLRLYKQSLDDIKFYQNELTNIEAKYLSLEIAKQTKNHKLISNILEELVKTERNFILENGQSTIEIEKEKISSANSSNLLKTVTDLLKSKN